ncbi:hypothetical protein Bbelb_240490 [Branchiostoma belcheri]|nr:hypothetical protein Bbelb_240490 [Branchiostoma belcheri]
MTQKEPHVPSDVLIGLFWRKGDGTRASAVVATSVLAPPPLAGARPHSLMVFFFLPRLAGVVSQQKVTSAGTSALCLRDAWREKAENWITRTSLAKVGSLSNFKDTQPRRQRTDTPSEVDGFVKSSVTLRKLSVIDGKLVLARAEGDQAQKARVERQRREQ